MNGRIVQVSISKGGLPKLPIFEGFCGLLGIEGDRHAHPRINGGRDKAILLIDFEAIEKLKLYAGAVGENPTTQDLDVRSLPVR